MIKSSPVSVILKSISLVVLLLSKYGSCQDGGVVYLCSNVTSYEGKWKLTKAYENGMTVATPKTDDVIFDFQRLKEGASDYSLSIDADNMFATSFNITGQTKKKCFDQINMGQVISTRKAPAEDFVQIEAFFSNNLEKMTKIRPFEEDGDLILIMKAKNAKIVCKYVPPPPPDYEGKWKITAAFSENGVAVSLPSDNDVIVDIVPDEKNPSSYKWNIEADNTFWIKVDIVGYDGNVNVIEVGPSIASTQKMPDPKYEAIETFIRFVLLNMNRMKMSENDNTGDKILSMRGDNGARMKLKKVVPT